MRGRVNLSVLIFASAKFKTTQKSAKSKKPADTYCSIHRKLLSRKPTTRRQSPETTTRRQSVSYYEELLNSTLTTTFSSPKLIKISLMELSLRSQDNVDVELGTDSRTGFAQRKPVIVRWAKLDKFVDPPTQQRSLLSSGPSNGDSSGWQSHSSTKQILTNVSFEACPGEILALMGPSGR